MPMTRKIVSRSTAYVARETHPGVEKRAFSDLDPDSKAAARARVRVSAVLFSDGNAIRQGIYHPRAVVSFASQRRRIGAEMSNSLMASFVLLADIERAASVIADRDRLHACGCSPDRTGLSLHFGEMQGDFRKMQGGARRNLTRVHQISRA
jgi:hypothetical protein